MYSLAGYLIIINPRWRHIQASLNRLNKVIYLLIYVCTYICIKVTVKEKETINLRVCDVPERLDKGELEEGEISFSLKVKYKFKNIER